MWSWTCRIVGKINVKAFSIGLQQTMWTHNINLLWWWFIFLSFHWACRDRQDGNVEQTTAAISMLLSRTSHLRRFLLIPIRLHFSDAPPQGAAWNQPGLREKVGEGKRLLTYANQHPASCQISMTPAWTEFSFYLLLSGAAQLMFQATSYHIP